MPRAIARGSCLITFEFGCAELWLTGRLKCAFAATSYWLQRKDMPMSNAQTDAKLGNQRRSCRPLGHLHVLRAQNERGNCAKLSLTRRTEPHMLDQTRRLVLPRLCGTISSGWKG